MLNILLIDNDLVSINKVFNVMTGVTGFECKIGYICKTENEIEFCIQDTKYDVIILNLNMTKSNPYFFLNKLKEKNILQKTITISNISKKDLTRLTNNYQEIFNNFSFPLDLNSVHKSIKKMYINIKKGKKIRKNITNILNIFNFNKSSLGYSYIIDCLNICISKGYKRLPKMNTICNEIAKQNNLTSSKTIDWNIQKAIKNMRIYTDSSVLNKYFSFEPSTKIFLNEILSIYYRITE